MSKAGAPESLGVAEDDLKTIVHDLRLARERWRRTHHRHQEVGGRGFPSRPAIEAICADLRGLLFPLRLGPAELTDDTEDDYVSTMLERSLAALTTQVRLELGYVARLQATDHGGIDEGAKRIVAAFASRLPEIRRLLDGDVEAAYAGDPAARSVDEVLICYPGLIAVIHHRLAHELHHLGAPLVARIIAQAALSETGIDIHPGASIGPNFFIDHGTGVVIGETTIIGSGVRLYQAVTLGAKSFPTDENGWLQKGLPRHPILEDDVVVYAGATILGRITIGKGSKIGGNVWLTHDVPPGSTVNQAKSQQDIISRRAPERRAPDKPET